MGGFFGPNCEGDTDYCDGVTCQNGGTCEDGINDYSCTCADGFTGALCETAIVTDPCNDVVCTFAQTPCRTSAHCDSTDGQCKTDPDPSQNGQVCGGTIDAIFVCQDGECSEADTADENNTDDPTVDNNGDDDGSDGDYINSDGW